MACARFLAACVVLGVSSLAAAQEVPLGHKDFYPSTERPLGFRGDGNGYFPGATPVTQWWEGTPTIAKGEKGQYPAYGDKTAKNVVWKTPLPGWGDAQPLPVGDRVFALSDPYFLTCIDVNTGKPLWQREVLPLECEGVPYEKARKIQDLFDIARASIYLTSVMKGGKTGTDPEQIDKPYVEKAIARVQEWKKIAEGIDPDPAIVGSFDKLVAQIEAYKGGGRGPAGWPFGNGTICDPLEKKYKLRINWCWYGHIGYAESTPVSDGERVYVILPQGQVACYDLNGNRVWAYRFTESEALFAHHLPSPLLCGDKLLARTLTGDVAAFDKVSGKKLWETEIGTGGNHGSYLSHKLMQIPGHDGKPVDILITNKRKILRVSDGKILGTYEHPRWNNGHGPSIVARGDLFYVSQSHDGPSTPFMAYRVKFTGPDAVEAPNVFQLETPDPDRGPFGNECVILTDKHVISYTSAWDALTGKAVSKATRQRGGGGPVIAGTFNIYAGGGDGNSPWGRPRPDRANITPLVVVDLANVSAAKIVASNNLLGGPELPADAPADKFVSGFDKLQFLGGYRGIGSWFGARNGGVYPSGNRIFIQAAAHLYCIGDPSQTFDWNPASRPERISKSLKDKE